MDVSDDDDKDLLTKLLKKAKEISLSWAMYTEAAKKKKKKKEMK